MSGKIPATTLRKSMPVHDKSPGAPTAVESMTPDYIIKYLPYFPSAPAAESTGAGMAKVSRIERLVYGSIDDAFDVAAAMVHDGVSLPREIQIYKNMRIEITVSVMPSKPTSN